MTDTVIFYEKPGCLGAAAQKRYLLNSGIKLDVRDLLSYPWTESELLSFFSGKAIRECFNNSAPAVKSGRVVPASLQDSQALAMMLDDPILIRRPLLQHHNSRQCGFESGAVFESLGLSVADSDQLDGCVHQAGLSGEDIEH